MSLVDDELKRKLQGSAVTQPHAGIDQGWVGPGMYYAAGSEGSMTNVPGVVSTMGNIPVPANQPAPPATAIAQAVANARAAHPAQVDAGLTPPLGSDYMTPVQAGQAGVQARTAELQQASRDAYARNMMIGENPHSHEVAYNNADQPYLKTKSLEERAQGWIDGKVAAQAQIQTPGAQRPYIQAENVLQGYHPDDVFYTGDQSQVPKAARDAYKAMTKPIANRIREAMAHRSTEFTSLDEVTRFVQDLHIDPLAGAFVGQTMTGLLQQHNPQLYKQLVGDRKAQKANDAELVAHIRRTDPGAVGVPDNALLAHAKADPAAMAAWENNPETRKWSLNPATGQMEQANPRKLTPQEEAKATLDTKDAVRTATVDRLKARADASGGKLIMTYDANGESKLQTPEAAAAEARKVAKEQRDAAAADRAALVDTPEMKRYYEAVKTREKNMLAAETHAQAARERALDKGVQVPAEVEQAYTREMARIAATPEIVDPSVGMSAKAATLGASGARPNFVPTPYDGTETPEVKANRAKGLRANGSPKGPGWLGTLKRPDGQVSTEISRGNVVNGQYMEYPLIVPSSTPDELQILLSGGKPTQAMEEKAHKFAEDRVRQGLSPFKEGEFSPAATPPPAPVAPVVPAEPTATGPNGQKIVFRNGQWVPM